MNASERALGRTHRPLGRIAICLGACLGVLALIGPWPRAEAATITFKCAIATVNEALHEWCKRYGARLERRSGGRLKAQVFPSNQLGLGPRMVEGVQLSTIEGHIVPPDFLVGLDPRFQLLTAPYLFEDLDHAYRVINDREFLDKFLALGDGKGFKAVSLIPYGPAGLVSRRPIRTPDDLRGKKIRVLATPIERAMMAALGATGVPMALGEVLPALQQGAVDAVQSSLTVFTTFKYYDVAKYHTNTNHYLITSIGMVSQKWYDGLPADLQQAVVEEGRAVHPELLDWTRNFHIEAAKVWKDQTKDGWIDLTPDQRAAFRKQMEGVDEKVGQQVAGVKEWLDLLRAKSKQHVR